LNQDAIIFMTIHMQEKLQATENRYEELTRLLSSPEVIADRQGYLAYSKEHAQLEPIVECLRAWRKVKEDLQSSRELAQESKDEDMVELAEEEINTLKVKEEELYKHLITLLLPKDPNDDKNIILEIRAGTGGEEAALFASDLLRMYTHYSEGRGWKVELISVSYATKGGYKEVIARITGQGAFSAYKYERGVHRVQRVPETEAQGRVHTSTVTVAVLPEAEEVEIEINEKDLRIDVFRASGPGGQSVNTTDSAVRVTHLPTNLVVICQDEKSQLKNKNKALMVLRARLLAAKEAEQHAERRDDRRSQVGTGERSERIRTYNFPQGRVTDHRIGLTLYQLDSIIEGDLNPLIEPLMVHDKQEALKQVATKESL
jgi:peptide chain release factor 1